MLSLTLVRRTARDYAILWASLLVLLVGFVMIFMVAAQAGTLEQGREMLKMPFVRRFLTVMMGADLVEILSPTTIAAFVFTHPFCWVLIIVFCLTLASGSLAGEVDRGTMDLLASLPVRRAAIYNSTGLVLLVMGWVLCWGIWCGVGIGREFDNPSDVRMDQLARVAVHLCATYTVIASFALAISSWSNRRGMAVAAAFALVFYAFALNILRALWPKLNFLQWTDFLFYYQTLIIVRDEAYRWGDIGVLLGASAVWWVTGLIVFTRRDIPAR